MALSTFPTPKKDPRFSFPNRFGVPDEIFTAIVRQSQIQINASIGGAVAAFGFAGITIDASAGAIFYISLTAPSCAIAAPTNLIPGKRIVFVLVQDGTGANLVTWDAIFRFSTDIPSPTLSFDPDYSDYVEFIYNEFSETLDCIRVVRGFAP